MIVIPVPFEATTSYGGGDLGGPAAVLEASKQVDLFDHETGRPTSRHRDAPDPGARAPTGAEIGMRLAGPVIEAGGAGDDAAMRRAVAEVDELGEQINDWVYGADAPLLGAGQDAPSSSAAITRSRSARSRRTPSATPGSGSCTSTRTPICATRTRASPGRTPRSSTT